MNHTQLNDQLTRLDEAGLIRLLDDISQTYGFRHALIQDSAYESTLRSDRHLLHRQVARAYEQFYPERSEEFAALIAHHYAQAGDHAQTVNYATLAGDAAMRRYAYPEARVNYALALQALAQLEDSPEYRRRKVEVLLNEVTASYVMRDPALSLVHLGEAEAALQLLFAGGDATPADHRQQALLHFLTGRAYSFLSENSRALEFWRQARAEAEVLGDEVLCTMSDANIGRLLANHGRFGEARRLLDQAAPALAAARQWREWVVTIPNLTMAMAMQGEGAQALALCEQALVRAEQIGFPVGITYCHFMLSLICFVGEDMPRSLAESSIALTQAQQAREYGYVYWAAGLKAWAELRLGQVKAATRSLVEASAAGCHLGEGFMLRDLLLLIEAELALARGQTDEALALVAQGLALARRGDNLLVEGHALRLRAQILAARGPGAIAEAFKQLEASLRVFEAAEATIEIAHTRSMSEQLRSVWPPLVDGL